MNQVPPYLFEFQERDLFTKIGFNLSPIIGGVVLILTGFDAILQLLGI